MKLSDIIKIADGAYPDGLVAQYHAHPKGNYGDTLAKFVALELKDTFDAKATEESQLRTAELTVHKAIGELANVQEAFWKRRMALKAKK